MGNNIKYSIMNIFNEIFKKQELYSKNQNYFYFIF